MDGGDPKAAGDGLGTTEPARLLLALEDGLRLIADSGVVQGAAALLGRLLAADRVSLL